MIMTETYIEEFRRLWTDRASSYSDSVVSQLDGGSYTKWLDEVLRDIPEGRKLKVLDVGCGPGFFSVILGRLGHKVTGIDYNEEMCSVAARNCRTYGVDADFMRMDAHHLEFDDDSFDLVVSRDVLWNLDDPARVYNEMYRVVRPGGKITVFDGNFYLYAHDRAYEEMDVEKHIDIYHKGEEGCRERLLRIADMATKLPASKNRRPQWDAFHLMSLGCSRVTMTADPENLIEFIEDGKKVHLPFTFSVSAFKTE
jgi:ubiquinone/menaquinone biosynthesis C-methylase UbiE